MVTIATGLEMLQNTRRSLSAVAEEWMHNMWGRPKLLRKQLRAKARARAQSNQHWNLVPLAPQPLLLLFPDYSQGWKFTG